MAASTSSTSFPSPGPTQNTDLTSFITFFGAYGYTLLMGDALTGKSLLMSRMQNSDITPDVDYRPTLDFVKYTIETPLGATTVFELSGQSDTWTFQLDTVLTGAKLVIILKHEDEEETHWKSMISAIRPNLPVVESVNMTPDFFRGILAGTMMRTYPIRHLMDPQLPSVQLVIEYLYQKNDKEMSKNITDGIEAIHGAAMIYNYMARDALKEEKKIEKLNSDKKKRRSKKSKKHRSKKSQK